MHEVQTADRRAARPVRRRRPPRSAAEIAPRSARAGAAHLRLRTDSDWLLDIVRFVAAPAARPYQGDDPMIRFLSPWWLLAAAAGPRRGRRLRLAAVRRRAYAMRFTNVDLLRTLAPKGLGLAPARRRRWRSCWPARARLRAWPGRRSTSKEPLERATVMLAHRRVAVDGGRRRAADPDRGGAGGGQGVRRRAAGRATTSGLVSFAKSANVLVSPTKDRDAVIAGDRRAAAGRGDRDRRGGVHLPGRDPVGAGRRRDRARRRPASCCSPTATARPAAPIEDAAAAAAGGQRAGLDDRVRHRRRAWSTSAGSCSGCRWTGRRCSSWPRRPRATSTRRPVGDELQAGVPGHGQLDRLPDGGPGGRPVVRGRRPAVRPRRRAA